MSAVQGDVSGPPGRLTPHEFIALFVAVVGYNVMHHGGVFFGTASAISDTRVADWLDMFTPVVVLMPLAWFFIRQRPSPSLSVVFGAGALLYVQGHGIHLSANSISNVIDSVSPASDVVHLWDEVVGHYVWYAGAALAALATVATVHGRAFRSNRVVVGIASAVSGLTWATNGLEGGTAVFSLTIAFIAVGYGIWHRAGAALAVAVAGSVGVAVLVGYGVWHGGFPQPSSL